MLIITAVKMYKPSKLNEHSVIVMFVLEKPCAILYIISNTLCKCVSQHVVLVTTSIIFHVGAD